MRVAVIVVVLLNTGVVSAQQADSHTEADDVKVDVTVTVNRDAPAQTDQPTPVSSHETGGFRFRPKIALALLGRELLDGRPFSQSGDIGLMIEPYYHHWVNLNVFVSFRCIALGVGTDVAPNLGVALLVGTEWRWSPGPILAVYLAF